MPPSFIIFKFLADELDIFTHTTENKKYHRKKHCETRILSKTKLNIEFPHIHKQTPTSLDFEFMYHFIGNNLQVKPPLNSNETKFYMKPKRSTNSHT